MLRNFERLIDPYTEYSQDEPPTGIFQFLYFYCRDVKIWLFILALTTVFLSILELIVFDLLGQIVDWIGTTASSDSSQTSGVLIFGFIVVTLLPIVGFLRSVVLNQVVYNNLLTNIRWKMHSWMMGQSYSYFQDEMSGRVASRINQTALGVRDVVLKSLDALLHVVIYFIGTITLAGMSSFWIAIPFICWILIYIGVLYNFLPRMGNLSAQMADSYSRMNGRLVDSYANIFTVKVFSRIDQEKLDAKESMTEVLEKVHPQMRLITVTYTILDSINALLLIAVAGTGVLLWNQSIVTIGEIAVGIGLVLRLQSMSHWVMWEMSALFQSLGIVYDGKFMLSTPRLMQDPPNPKQFPGTDGAVAFNDVSFNYGLRKKVLDGLSLQISGGEKVGIVGRSGAGKSTIAHLLLRLYDPEGGSIDVNGIDIRHVTQDSLRRKIGVVTQDISLMNRSILENILYGRPDATLEEVTSAAKKAGAHDFITALKDPNGRPGYDAHVGDRGLKLSGGQRQRIAIARVLLKDAPILIFDEATSALDSEIESIIHENLNELMHGKTVIAIAHRLSTLSEMNRVIVLDEGRIVEEGTHLSLSSADGLYAKLWSHQSGEDWEKAASR